MNHAETQAMIDDTGGAAGTLLSTRLPKHRFGSVAKLY